MISCAAIQKLERYGSLGLKRSTVEDFIQSSLKDPKRANIYALTHVETWEECRASLRGHGGEKQLCSQMPVGDSTMKEASFESVSYINDVCVSETLVYAISFAISLVGHHTRGQLPYLADVTDTDPVLGDSLTSAITLVSLWKEILQWMVKDGARRTRESPAFTQAVGHLLSNSCSMFFYIMSLEALADPVSDQERMNEVRTLGASAAVLVAAAVRLLRRSAAQHPVEELFYSRTCPTLLKRYVNKQGNQPVRPSGMADIQQAPGSVAALENILEALKGQPLLKILVESVMQKNLSSMGSFTLFQKLGLLHAVLATTFTTTSLLNDRHRAELQQLVASLLSSVACNRATRYVIYYRGDDVKLMQANVKHASDYALHTFATTPPLEDTLVTPLETATHNSVSRSAALLIAQWVVSLPFFFQSFCADPNWAAFAQEQRRMTILQQSQEKHQRREERRRRKATAPASAGSERNGSAPSSMQDIAGRGHTGGDDDGGSLLSYHTSGSVFSLESRASLLSTLSKASAASYMSFISVLRPGGAEESEMGLRKMHESADGNTNLPLILLEEIVLSLYNFMEAYPPDVLDRYGLRLLAWQSIGQLFSFVQSTITGANSSQKSTYAPSSAVFEIGQDLRYNRGMGYEVLGLLFAKVIAPSLDEDEGGAHRVDDGVCVDGSGGQAMMPAASSTSRSKRGRAYVTFGDGENMASTVGAALSVCLSAYECVAPQVVDMNLPVILRIAAKAALAKGASSARSSATVLFSFLADVTTRLGKSNQVPLLLDALVSHKATHGYVATSGRSGRSDAGGLLVDEEHVAALQLTFAHPQVRQALINACTLSMDPDHLLGRLQQYVTAWCTDDEEEGPVPLDPLDVLFVLQLVATVLEGATPTSVTSSAVLERSSELELLLASFLLQRLHEPYKLDAGEDALPPGNTFFNGPLSTKMRRRLVLYALYAIYLCREVTHMCLQDLGLRNVVDYIGVLEDTVWQVQSQVNVLVGNLTLDVLLSTVSSTTRMPCEPYIHVQVLLPQMVLQRLNLARSVKIMLGVEVAPLAEARRMVDYVLNCLQGKCGAMATDEGLTAVVDHPHHPMTLAGEERNRVLSLVDQLTDEAWSSIIEFGKSKRLREALVFLLKLSLSEHSSAVPDAGTNNLLCPLNTPPSWLLRCLRCAGGHLLRAIMDVVVSLSSEDVSTYIVHGSHGETANLSNATHLPALLRALDHVYCVCGRFPYWPALLERTVAWLLSLPFSVSQRAAKERLTSTSELLLALIRRCFVCEPKCSDVLRRTLVKHGISSALGDLACGKSVVEEGAGQSAVGSGGQKLNVLFVQAVGVPLASLADFNVSTVSSSGDGTCIPGEWCFEAELQDVTSHLFSKQMTQRLVEAAQLSDSVRVVAMGVLASLYRTALAAVQLAWRGRSAEQADCSHRHATALGFLDEVAIAFDDLTDSGFFSTSASVLWERAAAASSTLECFLCDVSNLFAHSMGTKGSSCVDSADTLLGTMDDVEKRWFGVLHKEVSLIVQPAFLRLRGPERTAVMKSFHTLFDLLLTNFGKRWQRMHGVKRGRGDVGETANKGIRASQSVSDFMRILLSSAPDEETNRQLREDICSLFSICTSTRGDLTNVQAAEHSVEVLVELLHFNEPASSTSLWILYKLFEEILLAGKRRGKEKDVQATGDDVSKGTHIGDGASVLRIVCAHSDPIHYAAGDTARQEMIAHLAQIVLQGGAPSSALGVKNSLCPEAAATSLSCSSEVMVNYFLCQLRAAPVALHVLHADSAPSELHRHMHALLNQTIPAPVTLSQWLGRHFSATHTIDGTHDRGNALSAEHQALQEDARRGYALLAASAEALQQLSTVPGMRFGEWKDHVKRLLWVSTVPVITAVRNEKLLTYDLKKHSVGGMVAGPDLWPSILSLCTLPLTSIHEDPILGDAEWLFLLSILGVAAGDQVTPTKSNLLTQQEMIAIVKMLSHTWLGAGILWKRSSLMPSVMGILFSRILEGVQAGQYERCVLNQFSSFLFQLVKNAESTRHDNNGCHGGSEVTEAKHDSAHGSFAPHSRGPSSAHHAARDTASTSTRIISLAAITSALFQIASHYLTVFTTYSSDLDFVASDLLNTLRRHHLPNEAVPFVSYRSGAVSRPRATADTTLCDLAFACVGEEDGKALLRQAALRVEEECDDRQTHRRFIFNVDD